MIDDAIVVLIDVIVVVIDIVGDAMIGVIDSRIDVAADVVIGQNSCVVTTNGSKRSIARASARPTREPRVESMIASLRRAVP